MKLFLLGMKPSNIQSENHLTAGSSTKIVILFPVVFFLNRAVPRAAVSAVPEMWHDFRHAFGHRELGCLLLHPRNRGGRVAKVYLETILPWLGVDFSEE
jgi:hypothetical protein